LSSPPQAESAMATNEATKLALRFNIDGKLLEGRPEGRRRR
jgi:hypothetical protein